MTYSTYIESFFLFLFTGAYLFMTAYSINKSEAKFKNFRSLCEVVFVVYISILLSMALFDRIDTNVKYLDLMPFNSYYKILTVYNTFDVYKLIVDNILVFIPFGILLPRVMNFKPTKRSCTISVLSGFALSLIIEVLQYVFSLGYSELDDIINNTFGCIIGVGVFAFGESISIKNKTIQLKLSSFKLLIPLFTFCALMFLIDIYREFILYP